MLLHLVDIAPVDGSKPAEVVTAIANELGNFSEQLADKPRWLVINKIDLLNADDLAVARDKLLTEIDWDGPVFEVSAATGEGTDKLAQAIIRALEEEDAPQESSGL